MPALRPTLRSPALAVSLAASLAAGCASPRPGRELPDSVTAIVPADPATALAVLRNEATRLGAHVTRESADSFTADFGVAPRRLAVARAGDASATSDAWIETEVHTSGTYAARPVAEGSLVTITRDTAWWHPERRVWLRLGGDARAAGAIAPTGLAGPR